MTRLTDKVRMLFDGKNHWIGPAVPTGVFYSGRGSQRKRRTATPAPATPQAASTARSRQSAPACWANAPVRTSLNGRTGSQPEKWLSSAEWIGP